MDIAKRMTLSRLRDGLFVGWRVKSVLNMPGSDCHWCSATRGGFELSALDSIKLNYEMITWWSVEDEACVVDVPLIFWSQYSNALMRNGPGASACWTERQR